MKPYMFNINDVYYCKSIRNKIMPGGMFTRIIYSNDLVSINGIHISFSLNGKIHEVYSNKYKFVYDVDTESKNTVETLEKIEIDILKNYSFPDKTVVFKLKEQLSANFFKFFQSKSHIKYSHAENNHGLDSGVAPILFSLKISGVWSTDNSYGITYKFTRV